MHRGQPIEEELQFSIVLPVLDASLFVIGKVIVWEDNGRVHAASGAHGRPILGGIGCVIVDVVIASLQDTGPVIRDGASTFRSTHLVEGIDSIVGRLLVHWSSGLQISTGDVCSQRLRAVRGEGWQHLVVYELQRRILGVNERCRHE